MFTRKSLHQFVFHLIKICHLTLKFHLPWFWTNPCSFTGKTCLSHTRCSLTLLCKDFLFIGGWNTLTWRLYSKIPFKIIYANCIFISPWQYVYIYSAQWTFEIYSLQYFQQRLTCDPVAKFLLWHNLKWWCGISLDE